MPPVSPWGPGTAAPILVLPMAILNTSTQSSPASWHRQVGMQEVGLCMASLGDGSEGCLWQVTWQLDSGAVEQMLLK